MKKLFLLCLLILSMNVFAQNKGDKYFLASGTFSFGQVRTQSFVNNHVYGSVRPMNRYLEGIVGFGYFVANAFRLEFAVSLYNEKDPTEKSGSVWLYDTFKGILFNPNLSFSVKLADKLYYTPEFGVGLDLGNYGYQPTYSGNFEYPYRGFSLYVNLLALQYRISEKFGLGMVIGNARFSNCKYYDGDNVFSEVNQYVFNLNQASINAYFYF